MFCKRSSPTADAVPSADSTSPFSSSPRCCVQPDANSRPRRGNTLLEVLLGSMNSLQTRRRTGIHSCTDGQFPSLSPRNKISCDRLSRAPLAPRPLLSCLRRNSPSGSTFQLHPSALSCAPKRKNASLQVLCLPLLRTPCRVSPFPATHMQTPGMGCRALPFFSSPSLCSLCLCGKFISFSCLRTLSLSLRSFSHPDPLFSIVCDSFAKTPGVYGVPALDFLSVCYSRIQLLNPNFENGYTHVQ